MKHPDATTTGQGQSYYRRKNLFPLRSSVSTNTPEATSSQILCRKKKNLRIPPHPTTKQRMLFLSRMGYPAQTMMNNILSEKEYQKYILKKLTENGYEIQPAEHYDRLYAISRHELLRFLEKTQPDEMEALKKIYKEKTEEVIVSTINAEETKKRGSRLDVLKHGVEISRVPLKLMYAKPATIFNKELNRLYEENIFSVSEEVWASDDEKIDLVVFLNGIAIMAFELKCNASGQNYENAILQYRQDRNPKTRLFRFKAGVLVCFAMDLEEVYMTTKLDGESTFFLPFNMGKGEGIETGAGNPVLKDEYSVHYIWDSILQKDSVLEIISKFMFIEVKEKEEDEKKAAKEGREHQEKRLWKR